MFLTVYPGWSPSSWDDVAGGASPFLTPSAATCLLGLEPSRKVRLYSALEEEVGILWKSRVESPRVTPPSLLCMISAR